MRVRNFTSYTCLLIGALLLASCDPEIKVPDPEFRDYLLENADMNHDGKLTRGDARTWNETRLTNEDHSVSNASFILPNAGITSLDGIEYFTALDALDCSNNQADWLLRKTGGNMSFIYSVRGKGVYKENGIKNLDLSKNTSLKTLRASCNEMESLILPKGAPLRYIDVSCNHLSDIDVSSLTELKTLIIDSNYSLGSLDVSGNPALRTVFAHGTDLRGIDVSALPLLDSLSVSSKHITSLDLRNNPGIVYLACSFSPELREILLPSSSKLSKLEASKDSLLVNNPNKDLTDLYEGFARGIRAHLKDNDATNALAVYSFQMQPVFSDFTIYKDSLAFYKERCSEAVKEKNEREAREAKATLKSLKENMNVTIGGTKLSFGGFSFGKSFTFDSDGYNYHFFTADKNCKYVASALSVTSAESDPRIPEIAIYYVNGSSLSLYSRFTTRFARWDDYATYIGNYDDYYNDFRKVNTVRFKVGSHIADGIRSSLLVVVAGNSNTLVRKYERYKTPPVWYESPVNIFPDRLELKDLEPGGRFILVKRLNF